MTENEIRIRSLYLFLACSQAIDRCKERLACFLPATTPSIEPLFEKLVKRELGLLFRYWATQRIWKALETNEEDAKNFNLAVLRQFFDGLRLPKDGSGLRYAELLTLPEQVTELSRRVDYSLSHINVETLLKELQQELPAWHASVMNYTEEALSLPMDRLAGAIKTWAERTPDVTV